MDHPLFDLPTAGADDLGAHGAFRLVGVFFPPLGEFQRSTYRVYGHDADGRYVSAPATCEVGEEAPGDVRTRLQQEATDDVRAMIDAIAGGAAQG
ncbi:MAG TPA: hypothetical protein VK610_09480 [Rhodothermales bacterium]|nr:hypothetical protein [Rhodothermales bacterium]